MDKSELENKEEKMNKGEPAAITPELYKAIIAIIDERVKDIRVTREDFNELREIVKELAQAQTRTEEELRNLAMQVAKLSENIGFSLEDIAKAVLPGYLERHFDIQMDELERRFFVVDSEEIEMNIYGEGKKNGFCSM